MAARVYCRTYPLSLNFDPLVSWMLIGVQHSQHRLARWQIWHRYTAFQPPRSRVSGILSTHSQKVCAELLFLWRIDMQLLTALTNLKCFELEPEVSSLLYAYDKMLISAVGDFRIWLQHRTSDRLDTSRYADTKQLGWPARVILVSSRPSTISSHHQFAYLWISCGGTHIRKPLATD